MMNVGEVGSKSRSHVHGVRCPNLVSVGVALSIFSLVGRFVTLCTTLFPTNRIKGVAEVVKGEPSRVGLMTERMKPYMLFSKGGGGGGGGEPSRMGLMPSNECFMCSNKESLAVGTELLVFGKEITSHVIWSYIILTNSWSSGMTMNSPRCFFGSASLGEIAILAGGCDSQGKVLSSAELYNSETGTWVTLPSMNKPRKMCSGVCMDEKFYVIGGINSELLSCGEEYNLQTRTWREIPNMFPGLNGPTEAPPLVAVVNNELYAADYAEKELGKYDKERNLWHTIGRLPEQAVSINGWGLAFRACGELLIVIGGPRALGGGIIELNSWVPGEGPPEWNVLASKHSGNFVYNCAVMGC